MITQEESGSFQARNKGKGNDRDDDDGGSSSIHVLLDSVTNRV